VSAAAGFAAALTFLFFALQAFSFSPPAATFHTPQTMLAR
jgi:hypothetical protein